MTAYEEGLKIMEDCCGNNKDNVIALATIKLRNGEYIPNVRDVDAYYESGVFYIVTHLESNKMKEIKNHPYVSFSVNFENIKGVARAVNLGWVLDPKNSELRAKLRKVFEKWYDEANNENDPNFIYLALHIEELIVVTGHGPTTKKYFLDLVHQKEMDQIQELKSREAYYYTFQGIDAIEQGKAFIFRFLSDNHINLNKDKGPIFIFGSYDTLLLNQETLIYTLYFILPKHIKLTEKPHKKFVLGGTYVKRFTNFKESSESLKKLFETYQTHDTYQIEETVIIEQYLLEQHEFTQETAVLQLLRVCNKNDKN